MLRDSSLLILAWLFLYLITARVLRVLVTTINIHPHHPASAALSLAQLWPRPRKLSTMISTSLHQYTPAFSHLPMPNMVSHEQHLSSQHMGASGLDTLAHTSQYALQFHQSRNVLPNGKGIVKQRHHPYSNGPIAAAPRSQRDVMIHERSGRGTSASGPVRRRISRACDQCNQLRTKCDGKSPCAHCMGEFNETSSVCCRGDLIFRQSSA